MSGAVTPLDLDRLPLGPRLRLTAEVVATYLRVRWLMRAQRARAGGPGAPGQGARGAAAGTALEREDEDFVAWRLARARSKVLARLPSDSRCLFSSLTLMCMLERRGVDQAAGDRGASAPFRRPRLGRGRGRGGAARRRPGLRAPRGALSGAGRRLGEEATGLLAEAARSRRAATGGRWSARRAGASEAGWRCWLSGRLTNADEWAGASRPPSPASRRRARPRPARSPACDLLRGSFVVVAAERRAGQAVVARDQLGGRPLVYAELGDGALFAEHERELLALLPTAPGPDRLCARRTGSTRGGLPAGRTLYDGHRAAAAGAPAAALGRGRSRSSATGRPRYEGTVAGSRGGGRRSVCATEAFAAVDPGRRGATAPAVRLSGGLDSACVAAGLAARGAAEGGALALAAVFPGRPETDERELIEATARHAGLDAGAGPLRRRRFDLAPGAAPHRALAPAARLAQPLRLGAGRRRWRASAASTAMLDGEGGDELFGLAPYLIADAPARRAGCARPGR